MEFKTFDGKTLHIHQWPVQDPRGVVQIVHGMAEHGERYGEFARFLNSHGFYVLADDHRGHGRTDPGTLGWCAGDMFADTVRDEAEIAAHFRDKYPGAKYFLFGFSYGSFITQSFLGKYGGLLDGAIIGGSNRMPSGTVRLGVAVSHLLPAKKPARLIERLSFGGYERQFEDRQWLSVDPENNAVYAADPFCGFTCSARFYRDFFGGLSRLYTDEYIHGLPKSLPLLIASGADDPVGEKGEGVRRLYDFYTAKANMQNVRLVLFPGSRHEYLNEHAARDKKWGAILTFLEENS